MTQDELKIARRLAWEKLKQSTQMLSRATILYESIKTRHQQDYKEHLRLDRELALLDGRLKIIPPAEGKGTNKKTKREFTREDLIAIAKQLGVDLGVEEL